MTYLDHAATSWPKPPAVPAAMREMIEQAGGNPGRSGHRMAMRAGEIVYTCRENLAKLFGVRDPLRICFTSNATESLNLAIKGSLQPGDHAVFSAMEHNSVWRPLRELERRGVRISMAPAGPDGIVRCDSIVSQLRPDTRLIVLIHASNVNGALNPVEEVGRIARERNVRFLVDASQTAGVVPIDVEAMKIRLEPLKHGGTGSESESSTQPEFAPDRYESGTLNTPGIAGLNEGVKCLLRHGVAEIRRREQTLTERLLRGLVEIQHIHVYGPANPCERTGVISFNIEGLDPVLVADELDRTFDIACRAGLHCAYLAHRTQGTNQTGAVRFSFGALSTEGDLGVALAAVRTLAQEGRP
ncbi:MAG: aminotransferase class V-fold PLP-dependent enzyme [Bryobacteraceae bacterium]